MIQLKYMMLLQMQKYQQCNACDSALIKFTDISQSKDAITHHYWYFGDNDSADAAQISHSYNKTGTYNATLNCRYKTWMHRYFAYYFTYNSISITAHNNQW